MCQTGSEIFKRPPIMPVPWLPVLKIEQNSSFTKYVSWVTELQCSVHSTVPAVKCGTQRTWRGGAMRRRRLIYDSDLKGFFLIGFLEAVSCPCGLQCRPPAAIKRVFYILTQVVSCEEKSPECPACWSPPCGGHFLSNSLTPHPFFIVLAAPGQLNISTTGHKMSPASPPYLLSFPGCLIALLPVAPLDLLEFNFFLG